MSERADPLPVPPARAPAEVAIVPPGSKSVTCRACVLAALAAGRSRLRRPLRSDDADRLLAALETLGARVARDGEDVLVEGAGGRFPGGGRVDLGDGGAPARFMMAAACLASGPVIVDGSRRLRQRPMAELVELLRRLGARIEHLEADGQLPVRVEPAAALRGGALEVTTTQSSQFLTALLLIAPALPGGLELRFAGPVTSRSYLDLTLETLRLWGASVTERPEAVAVAEGLPAARTFAVPPDASSATYWWSAAALVPGLRIETPGVPGTPAQPDDAFLDRLATLERGEPVDMSLLPDAAMSLAAVAAMGSRPALITGLATLRVKETDRIAALAAELRRIGCGVEATGESLRIDPATRHDRPVVIETYNDHRMAMAFAILGLARGGISIADPACVAKSYPGFWDDLARLTRSG